LFYVESPKSLIMTAAIMHEVDNHIKESHGLLGPWHRTPYVFVKGGVRGGPTACLVGDHGTPKEFKFFWLCYLCFQCHVQDIVPNEGPTGKKEFQAWKIKEKKY
jgi:hypothetical protein